MSKPREKVFDDPLSMFGAAPSVRDEEVAEKPADTPPPAVVEETVFRTIDTSKVAFKKKKEKAVEGAVVIPVLPEAEKGLGFAVDLWGNDSAVGKNTIGKKEEVDIFARTDYHVIDNDNLFGFDSKKHVAKSDDEKPLNVGETKTILVRGTKNDEDLSSLKSISHLIEREDNTSDFDIFGKVKIDNNQIITKTISKNVKKDKDLFENVSEDYLNELEALTSDKAPSPSAYTYTSKASTATATLTLSVAPVKDIDMSSLDLDAYINQQESNTGGGLFD